MLNNLFILDAVMSTVVIIGFVSGLLCIIGYAGKFITKHFSRKKPKDDTLLAWAKFNVDRGK